MPRGSLNGSVRSTTPYNHQCVAYLVLAVVLAAVLIGIISLRYRLSNDPAKSVDSFQRAIKALKAQKKSPGKPRPPQGKPKNTEL